MLLIEDGLFRAFELVLKLLTVLIETLCSLNDFLSQRPLLLGVRYQVKLHHLVDEQLEKFLAFRFIWGLFAERLKACRVIAGPEAQALHVHGGRVARGRILGQVIGEAILFEADDVACDCVVATLAFVVTRRLVVGELTVQKWELLRRVSDSHGQRLDVFVLSTNGVPKVTRYRRLLSDIRLQCILEFWRRVKQYSVRRFHR